MPKNTLNHVQKNIISYKHIQIQLLSATGMKKFDMKFKKVAAILMKLCNCYVLLRNWNDRLY